MRRPASAPRDRHVAVTGAGGFLGGWIAVALAAAGWRVTALGRSAPAALADPGRRMTATAWDGRQPPPEGLRVDAVVDCAAAIPARVADPDLLMATNKALARGAADLAARTGGPVIYMSSQSAIGRPAVAVMDDTTPAAPDTPYGRSKRAAERLLADAVAAGTIAGAVAVRLPAVVGRGCHDNFPATVAASLAAGRAVTVFNPESPYNAVVHADSVAAFVRRLLTAWPTGFHAVSVASRPAIPVREAVAAIAEGLGRPCRMEDRPPLHASPVIDPAGAEALGFVADDTRAVLLRFGAEAR